MPPSWDSNSPTARPPALEALRYQAILDTARDAIISIDRHGLITDFNQAAVIMFGYGAEEVVGRDMSMLMPSPYRGEHAGYMRAYARTGDKKAIGRIREVEAQRKNGETFPIELSVSEARVGQELLYTAIIRDVKALRRAQAADNARHEVTRVLAIFDTIADAAPPLLEVIRTIGNWDAGELWTVHQGSQTQQGIAVLRYQSGAFASQHLEAAFEDTSRAVHFACGEALLGRAWEESQRVVLIDRPEQSFAGRESLTRLNLRRGCAFPIRDDHDVVAVMAFYGHEALAIDDTLVRLVTSLATQIGDFIARERAKVELQRLEAAAEERARFADIGAITTRLVHDLGNPLSGISMQAELLKRKIARAEPHESLMQPIDRIFVGISRLRELVRGFTDFAREQRLDLTSIDLHAFLGDLTEHWQPVAAARDVHMLATLSDALPPLNGDEAKLRRVFDNLLKNAIEAIEQPGGEVRIEAHAGRDDRVRIAIADTGSGIPSGIEVFKLFETTKPLGTGIGLPVSKEIIGAHGGVISFLPNVPRGTVFTVELPVTGPAPL